MSPVPSKYLQLGAWWEPNHFCVVCNAGSWIFYTAVVHDSCRETAASWFNSLTPRLFCQSADVEHIRVQRFVRPEDVDAELAYKADHSSEEVRVDVGLVVESCGCCREMGTRSVDPKHPPEVWLAPKAVWAGVQKRSVWRWVWQFPP